MDQVQHKFVDVGGLKLHVAEIGTGQKETKNLIHLKNQTHMRLPFDHSFVTFTGPNVVLFLHGFPEIWYSWRHQMIALAKAGFRAIAPDHRGYGLSDPPPQPDKASFADILTDLLNLLDALQIAKVLKAINYIWYYLR